MCHLGVTDLVRKGKYSDVADLLLEDEKHVAKVFSGWPEQRQRVEHTLKLLKATLFAYCVPKPSGGAAFKLLKDQRRQEKKMAKKAEKEQRKKLKRGEKEQRRKQKKNSEEMAE
jgi:hypothetical protein